MEEVDRAQISTDSNKLKVVSCDSMARPANLEDLFESIFETSNMSVFHMYMRKYGNRQLLYF